MNGHHVWCNMDHRVQVSECVQCKKLFERYPPEDATPDDLMTKHFPQVAKLNRKRMQWNQEQIALRRGCKGEHCKDKDCCCGGHNQNNHKGNKNHHGTKVKLERKQN